ncbi:hypothetical protein F5B22DRAFT_646236 [Xylaria bambusicola]|uniref:uncharacterized protein n=1 Tax=Xylaria bambusicola TaxID=326684 RepID=UPI0020075BB0|nr:uncharacterized protein F5B22DRAFT_646236 [Xylaria bambusicola]KAI0516889.1 hypothetical protein F5B22DRAFT_646236 [Xylaria bambusicola]
MAYSTNFRPYDAREGFHRILRNTQNWMEHWIERKLLSNDEVAARWLESLYYFPHVLTRFRNFLVSHPDIHAAVGYPGSDGAILVACVLRFVCQNIFGDLPCSISPQITQLLNTIEDSMSNCSHPRIDRSARRIWRAQANHALFTHPQHDIARQERINTYTLELAEIFAFVCTPHKKDKFLSSIAHMIIEPSFALYEDMSRSHLKYQVDWKAFSTAMHGLSTQGLERLVNETNCVNAANNNSQLTVADLRMNPNIQNPQKHIFFLCSIYPALKVDQFMGDNSEKRTLVQERMLVAWDPSRIQGDPSILKVNSWLVQVCSMLG